MTAGVVMSPRRAFAAVLLAAGAGACGDGVTPPAAPLRFEATAVPAERSAISPVVVAPGPPSVVVRGGFFVGAPRHVLEARYVRTAPRSGRLEVTAVPAPGGFADGASHYDYVAVVPAADALDLAVVHRVSGAAAADTVFRARVF